MDYRERFAAWLADDGITEDERLELLSIKGNDEELRQRFSQNISFGTAGLRGVIGAGSSCMNIYNVKKASQALASILLDQDACPSVVVSYDSRHMSKEFALASSLVFCANGIKTYLFDGFRPVPMLSFAVRHLRCSAGIEITASHNPKEYNGYKAYAAYGGQLSPEDCAKVMEGMDKIHCMADVKAIDEQSAVQKNLLIYVGKEIDDAFINGIKKFSYHKPHANISIVYTPMFGTGMELVPRILREQGYEQLYVVQEQSVANPDFPGISSPNPENRDSLDAAVALAKKVNADIIIATDPDADRLACCVPNKDQFFYFSGNQTACLLLSYILSSRSKAGSLPKEGIIAKSIVSTTLANDIAASYGFEIREVLTGFRYISELVDKGENESLPFLFAFEESIGYLVGDLSRDKDGISAAMLLCEAASYYKADGKTLYDVLQELYQKHGWYSEETISVPFEGIDGALDMEKFMSRLRSEYPTEIGGIRATAVRDYKAGIKMFTDGVMENLTLPESDVLYFELDGGSWTCLRPSGTEPKLKAYVSARAETKKDADALLFKLKRGIQELLNKQ